MPPAWPEPSLDVQRSTSRLSNQAARHGSTSGGGGFRELHQPRLYGFCGSPFSNSHQIKELDPVEFRPDVFQPVPHIATQHEGMVGGKAVGSLVGDEIGERSRHQLDLLVGHFAELRDSDL